MSDIYQQLAQHLSALGMGLPNTGELIDILKENFNRQEAEIALLLPTRVAPLQLASVQEIASHSSLPREELAEVLENLAARGLLFSGKIKDGERGYALQQVGFGFPQSFFWKGENTSHAQNMANLLGKYFNRQVLHQAYAASETKPYRYIPLKETIEHEIQAVYPYHMVEKIIEQASIIAVSHCPCRVVMELRGKGCHHPLEVCLKFDNMAKYLLETGLGREISKDEALKITKDCGEAGLVHFVDNAQGEAKHICNCCGCACWNVGTIKRRKIPRDVLMATYFMRYTLAQECNGCGKCVKICPVDALTLEGDLATVDDEWCIGCGVCVPRCPTKAAKLSIRSDVEQSLPSSFTELHKRILQEKGLEK